MKRKKIDAADAKPKVILGQKPKMRFAEAWTAEEQSHAAVFRSQQRLFRQRSGHLHALQALLYEHGHVFPTEIRYLDR